MKTSIKFKHRFIFFTVLIISSCDDNAHIKMNLSNILSEDSANSGSGVSGGGQLLTSPNGYNIKAGIGGISGQPKLCNHQGFCAQVNISR